MKEGGEEVGRDAACLQVQRTFVDQSLVESLYFGLKEREKGGHRLEHMTEVDNHSVSKETQVNYTYASGFNVFSSLVLQ